jgi:excisionase family DNA binding protein
VAEPIGEPDGKFFIPAHSELHDFNSVAEVAAYLRVSARHLYNVIASGRLGCVRVGTLVRIKREQVERYLAENTKEARA